MTLATGTRLDGGPGSIYEVIGPAWDDDRNVYLHARKLFRNFRYPADSLDEAPADEALDVLIRRPRGGSGASDFEREAVLTLPRVPYFLEWIDLIDPPEQGADGPWLVFADPHARPLDLSGGAESARMIGLAFDALGMLDALHRSGLVAGVMEASDFVPRGLDRWYFLRTDRIRPVEGSGDAGADLRTGHA